MPSALIFQTELEIPLAPRSAAVFWAELEIPLAVSLPKSALIFWAELEIPLGYVPSLPYLGGMGTPNNDLAGAFSGRTGALPSRGQSDKSNFLQWNWKLGNIVGDREWKDWQNRHKKSDTESRKLIEDVTIRHQYIVKQREQEDLERRKARQVELARWRINKLMEGKSMSQINRQLEVKMAMIEGNRMKKEQHLLVEDALALQRKIKMAKLRAKRRQ